MTPDSACGSTQTTGSGQPLARAGRKCGEVPAPSGHEGKRTTDLAIGMAVAKGIELGPSDRLAQREGRGRGAQKWPWRHGMAMGPGDRAVLMAIAMGTEH